MDAWPKFLQPYVPYARFCYHYLFYRLGRRPAISPTSAAEQAALVRHATGRRRLAEIGVFQGGNTLRLRQVMDPQAVLLAVDPYARPDLRWCRLIAHREVRKSDRGTVIWVETTGAAAVALPVVQAHLPVDFLFIDGDHSWEGIAGDWAAWSDRIAPGGVVALHDSVPSRYQFGSERFTQEIILPDARFEHLETAHRLTVVRRR